MENHGNFCWEFMIMNHGRKCCGSTLWKSKQFPAMGMITRGFMVYFHPFEMGMGWNGSNSLFLFWEWLDWRKSEYVQ